MKIEKNIKQGSSEWLSFREGKISGTKIGKLFAKSLKVGELINADKPLQTYYEVIAERLAVGTADKDNKLSSDTERGLALETEATKRAVSELKLTNIATDGVWIDSECEDFICSPDSYEDVMKPKWAMEIKCLSSANHIKAIIENKYPNGYKFQILNYFLLCPSLEKLYFVMYDPRFIIEKLQLKIFTIERAGIEYEIELLRDARIEAENQIRKVIREITK